MRSHDIPGFTNWEKWSQRTPSNAPRAKGIYVFRLADGRPFGRLRGQSDVIYVGATREGKQTVQGRLKQHATPRGDEKDTGILLARAVQAGYALEISWKTCESDFLAQLEEGMLLDQYERDHLELPPLNGSRPLKGLSRASNTLKSMPQEQRASILSSIRARRQPQSGP